MTDKCPRCGGRGWVSFRDGDMECREPCPYCAYKDGAGELKEPHNSKVQRQRFDPAPVSSVDVEALERRNTPDCEWCGRDGSLTGHYDDCAMPIIRALAAENERLRELVRGLVPRDLTKAGSWVVVDARAYRELQRAALEGKGD